MNRRAASWGLECTHFASSHGLEDGNRSCARDLAVMTRLAMAEPRIRRIVRRRQVELPLPDQGRPPLPLRPQPPDPPGLPRRDRPQDRLHQRRGPLLRGSGAQGRPPPRRGAAQLTRSCEARAEAAGRGLLTALGSHRGRLSTGSSSGARCSRTVLQHASAGGSCTAGGCHQGARNEDRGARPGRPGRPPLRRPRPCRTAVGPVRITVRYPRSVRSHVGVLAVADTQGPDGASRSTS